MRRSLLIHQGDRRGDAIVVIIHLTATARWHQTGTTSAAVVDVVVAVIVVIRRARNQGPLCRIGSVARWWVGHESKHERKFLSTRAVVPDDEN